MNIKELTATFLILILYGTMSFVLGTVAQKHVQEKKDFLSECNAWKDKIVSLDKTTDDYKLFLKNPEQWRKYNGYESPEEHYEVLNKVHYRSCMSIYKAKYN